MDNGISAWVSKIMLIIMCLSPFFIARIGEQYYIAATGELLAEEYISTVNNGILDIEEYTDFCYRVADFGYESELVIIRYGEDGYYDYISTNEILTNTIQINNRSVYQLQNNDFVYVKLISKSSVIKESNVFRGEGIL